MAKILMHINYNIFLQHYEEKNANQFTCYETPNLVATWGEVQHAFISRFSDVCNEKQAIITLRGVKQWKHEMVEDYYDRFLKLCVVIPQ